MDTVIGDFCSHLEIRFMNGKQSQECDLGKWIAFCEQPHIPEILYMQELTASAPLQVHGI